MKIIIKQNNIFENKGKTKQQIMKIEDKMANHRIRKLI